VAAIPKCSTLRPQLQRWFAFYDSNAENRGTRWSKFAILIYALYQEGKLPNLASFHIFASAARCRGIRLESGPTSTSSGPTGTAQAKAKAKGKGCKRGRPAKSSKPDSDLVAADASRASGSRAPDTGPSADNAPSTADNIKVGDKAGEQADNMPEEGQGKKLKEMFSAMQAAAIALSFERNCLGMDMIHFLVAPIRRYYAHVQESVRSGPGAIRHFFSELAVGSMQKANIEIWVCLRTPDVLCSCGLTLERTSQAEDEIFDGDTIMLEQDSIANQLDNFALCLIAERVDESCTHQHDFIARCAGLLHQSASVKEQTLLDLRNMAHAFRRALLHQTGSATLQSVIQQSAFHGSVEKACPQPVQSSQLHSYMRIQ
jgi:hypothetical protein